MVYCLEYLQNVEILCPEKLYSLLFPWIFAGFRKNHESQVERRGKKMMISLLDVSKGCVFRFAGDFFTPIIDQFLFLSRSSNGLLYCRNRNVSIIKKVLWKRYLFVVEIEDRSRIL